MSTANENVLPKEKIEALIRRAEGGEVLPPGEIHRLAFTMAHTPAVPAEARLLAKYLTYATQRMIAQDRALAAHARDIAELKKRLDVAAPKAPAPETPPTPESPPMVAVPPEALGAKLESSAGTGTASVTATEIRAWKLAPVPAPPPNGERGGAA